MVRTSERVHGEASERALTSRQRGVQETRSKVTPATVALVTGGKSRLFSFFVNDPVTFSPFFCGAWRANEISQPVTSKLSVCRLKSDVKRCNESLEVVCAP